MSTIKVNIGTQPLDFSPVTLGSIYFEIEYDGITVGIRETLSYTPSGYKFFKLIPWVSPGVELEQSVEYANAINRDYANVGNTGTGLQKSNINAFVDANEDVIITAERGIFKNPSYNGNALNGVSFSITNTPQEIPKSFDYIAKETGSCGVISLVGYTAQAATGGNGSYKLILNGNEIFSGWDGNADQDFDLERGKSYSGYLYDSANTLISSVTIRPPRLLSLGDFSVDQEIKSNATDIVVRTITEVNGTSPLEYSLEDEAGISTPWGLSNTFPGLLPGLYTIHIRDKFGCSISKQIEVYEFTDPGGENDLIRHFSISNFNSLTFREKIGFDFVNRPNFENTLSYEEKVGRPYQTVFKFPATSVVKTQFKSSYPIHVCTLLKSDGTKQSLALEMIQKNIGAVEKIDCKIFPLVYTFQMVGGGTVTSSNGTAVYFEGGTNYEPNSETADPENPTSPYNGGLPPWATVGNSITFDGIGTHEIVETDLYDEERGVMYFRIENVVDSEVSEKVQVTYNRHPYNLFRMDFSMQNVQDHAKIVIEAGWAFDQIERRFDSEVFKLLEDPKDHLKITWRSDINFDDMVFSDGIDCEMWIKGRIRPFPIGESTVKRGDDRTRSLKQRHRVGQRLEIPIMSANQWDKLCLASGIADDGEFRIENMLLILTSPPEFDEELGDTNLSSITAEYEYGGESLAKKANEIVLIPSQGIEGTAQTGTEPKIDPVLRLLRLPDGTWIKTKSGKYISLPDI